MEGKKRYEAVRSMERVRCSASDLKTLGYNNQNHEHLFYIAEDRRAAPKESFQLINSVLREQCGQWKTLCDVGCAAGDFLYYMPIYATGKRTEGRLDWN